MNDYFDKIICINRASRTDRWYHFLKMCRSTGITADRFEAHEGSMPDGSFSGNYGCTASHRGVLELISHHGWKRTLIFEDDADEVKPGRYADHAKDRLPFKEQWEKILPEIPDDWDALYLGGGYASKPQGRLSPSIIRVNTMMTTSSYAVTHQFARKICPHIHGVGPIDCLISNHLPTAKAYCVQPRLFVQYENESDIQHRVMDNAMSMLDPGHEAMV
jgi:hypothetical protein